MGSVLAPAAACFTRQSMFLRIGVAMGAILLTSCTSLTALDYGVNLYCDRSELSRKTLRASLGAVIAPNRILIKCAADGQFR